MRARHKKIWNDNSGFTLVELLVVLAIISILTGMAVLSFSVVGNADVNKAARNYSSILSKARTESMAKGTDAGQLNLIYENNRLYYWIGTEDASTAVKEEVCSSMIDVSLAYDANGIPSAADFVSGQIYTIRFSTSGMVEPMDPSSNTFLSKVVFSRGNRTVETVLYLTGKNKTMLVSA